MNGPAIRTLADASGEWVSIGATNVVSIYGDVNCIVTNLDVRSAIYWQPNLDWPGRRIDNGVRAQVKAWSLAAPPDYMVIDLVHTNVIDFYTCKELVPGGVINSIYKTDKLVMRRIPAAADRWFMGAPAGEVGQYSDSWKTRETQHRVTLSKDYYISVFEFTQGQYKNLKKASVYVGAYARSDRAVHPLEFSAFNDERGDASSNADYNWPNRTKVKPTGLFGRLATWTGFTLFDAPTEAQWEYACRAGTTTGLNNGTELANNNDPMASGVVGWCKGVDGNDPDNTQEVGLKVPNAWGIYDMHGNVVEWCRDWWYDGALGNLNQPIDPVGPTNGTHRVLRGGSFSHWPFYSRSACRETKETPDAWGSQLRGFRVICELPLRNVVVE
ncbi:MAG: formylglycine-generating enzyme family protein [Kiritimatiellia bacterium]